MTKRDIEKNTTFTYISLFSGIGGFETALNKIGGKLLLSSEKDTRTENAYSIIFGHKTYGDVTKIDEKNVPEHDILVGGFPCQAFSISGKRKGFEDARGTLFFSVARIVKEKQPKYLLLENVTGLLSHDKGNTFEVIASTLIDIGYRIDFHIINSQDHGLPQSRARVYILCIREDLIENEPYVYTGATSMEAKMKKRLANLKLNSFNFPWDSLLKYNTKSNLLNIASRKVSGNLFPAANIMKDYIEGTSKDNNRLKFVGGIKQKFLVDDNKVYSRNFSQGNRIYDSRGVVSTLTASNVGGIGKYSSLYFLPIKKPSKETQDLYEKLLIQHKGKDYILWVPKDTSKNQTYEVDYDENSSDCMVRALVPKETYRAQGFPDSYYDKLVAAGVSERQLYKMSGNAVSVNVIEHITTELFKFIEEKNIEKEIHDK